MVFSLLQQVAAAAQLKTVVLVFGEVKLLSHPSKSCSNLSVESECTFCVTLDENVK